MMAIVLFALIGTSIDVNWVYWVCFGVVCLSEIYKVVCGMRCKR